MTEALKKAFAVAASLPVPEQEKLAAAIFVELDADACEESPSLLRPSLEELERLAGQALAEHRAGRTKPLDPETL